MLYQDGNSPDPRGRRSCGRRRNAITFACLLPVVAAGCGYFTSASRSAVSVEIIRGKDSAGAIIELEKRGDKLTRARVIDMILGVGEAEIISDEEGRVEFTIDFPAGATITYVGTVQGPGATSAQEIAGTWTQHSAGIFAEDEGTWSASEEMPGS